MAPSMLKSGDPSEPLPLVLIADDDDMQRLLISKTLKKNGFQVREAADGEAAIAAFHEDTFELVLLDVTMPKADGFEVCAAIRATLKGAHVPVLMMTGQKDLSSIDRAYEVGATDFIAKPITWRLLGHRVRYLHRAGLSMSDLRASQHELAEAQRIANLGSWRWYCDRKQLRVSSEVQRIFGIENKEHDLNLNDLLNATHPDDRYVLAELHSRTLEKGEEIAVDIRLNDQTASRTVAVRARTEVDEGCGTILRGTFQDVTERRATEARLHHLAHHDSLTNLPNRSLLNDRLEQALARARRDGTEVAVLCIDIDRFKDINDTYGHNIGDELLIEVANRLQAEVRGSDTVARLGGDEFAVIQFGLSQPRGANTLCHRLLKALTQPYELAGHSIPAGSSVGVAMFPADADKAESLLIKADMALYRAKADGRGTSRFFEEGMDKVFRNRKRIEEDLRRALEGDWFELHYQPQIAVQSEEIVGVEALLRLRHPTKGIVPPLDFMAVAEETGLIVPIGRWALRKACTDAASWRRKDGQPIRVAVNLSPIQFRQPTLVQDVKDALLEAKLDPTLLEIEITENVLLHDTALVLNTLNRLKSLGVLIAMDDFGTGYSSLSYLQRFPFDRIKIDQSFIRELSSNPDAAAIVRAVVALGRSLNISTTAEGVETAPQFAYLKGEVCDEVQGYYFDKPLPYATLMDRLQMAPPDKASPEYAAT